jgi:hypothetical protein
MSNNPSKELEDLVLILTTKSQIYAEMVKDALEGEDIPMMIKSIAGNYSRGMLPFAQSFFDYRLYVTRANEERAREMVETIVPPEEMQ